MGDGEDTARGDVSLLRWIWEWTKIVATALVVFLFLRSFVVEAFQIPTSSMENTLLVGDFLLVNKAVYGAELPGTEWDLPGLDRPGRGDVVVFRPPPAAGQPPEARYVKRIVGVPGDTLSMRNGKLFRNDERAREPYAKHVRRWEDPFSPRFLWQKTHLVREGRRERQYRPTRDNWGPIYVPADSFFVMGDNRDNSEDSRYWGYVSRDAIEGRPLFIYYSYDREDPASLSWLTEVRWRRFLTPVR
jgi:signal peptidase I